VDEEPLVLRFQVAAGHGVTYLHEELGIGLVEVVKMQTGERQLRYRYPPAEEVKKEE